MSSLRVWSLLLLLSLVCFGSVYATQFPSDDLTVIQAASEDDALSPAAMMEQHAEAEDEIAMEPQGALEDESSSDSMMMEAESDTARRRGGRVGRAFRKAAGKVGKAARKAGGKIKKAARKVGKKLKKLLKKLALKKRLAALKRLGLGKKAGAAAIRAAMAARAAAKAAKKAALKSGAALKKAGKAVGKLGGKLARALLRGGKKVGKLSLAAARALARKMKKAAALKAKIRKMFKKAKGITVIKKRGSKKLRRPLIDGVLTSPYKRKSLTVAADIIKNEPAVAKLDKVAVDTWNGEADGEDRFAYEKKLKDELRSLVTLVKQSKQILKVLPKKEARIDTIRNKLEALRNQYAKEDAVMKYKQQKSLMKAIAKQEMALKERVTTLKKTEGKLKTNIKKHKKTMRDVGVREQEMRILDM